jgi:hypothetical protein
MVGPGRNPSRGFFPEAVREKINPVGVLLSGAILIPTGANY